jgi:hypothetical protein
MNKIVPGQIPIKKINDRLGKAVLLPIPKGYKHPYGLNGWEKLTWEQTQKPGYQLSLALAPGTGVLLGRVSEDLCAIDVDQDRWVEPILAAMPFLRRTLRTRGRRGCHFWLRIKGDYPHKKLTFTTAEQIEEDCKRGDGKRHHVAEFRTDGCQSVIRGPHKDTGKAYQWLVDVPVIEITWDQIKWPPEWVQVGSEEVAPQEKKREAGSSLHKRIRDSIRELCRHYYPNGEDTGDEYRLGSAGGEAGTSFCIRLEGEKAGCVFEHNGNEGGFFTDALAQKLGVRVSEAESEIRSFFVSKSFRLPPTLSKKALYGTAGAIATKAAKVSEADAAGILVQFLIAFGNMVGRGPFTRASGDFHRANLNALIVGRTAKDRKGLALGIVRLILGWVDEDYAKHNIKAGLSSGEGLIAHVQDPVKRFQRPSAAERRKGVTEPIEYVAEPGVSDKRLLAAETEFGGVLVVMGREGNSLSAVVRQFWDGADCIQTLTKNSPVRSTGAHVSICGHITHPELVARLPEVENFNGFANRFLWVSVRRDRYIPNPQDLDLSMFKVELEQLRRALEQARSIKRMRRDEEAEAYWAKIYDRMERAEEPNTQLDAVLSRGAAQTLRLSIIYALLDSSATIQLKHLEAAYAVWRYCRDSCRYFFAEKLSTAIAERLLAALKKCAPKGMTRWDVNNFFGRNLEAARIDAAIGELEKLRLIRSKTEKGKGAPKTTYFYDPSYFV